MRAKDIKVGIVYAYRTSKYHTPRPIVFLDEAAPGHIYAGERPGRASGKPRFKLAPNVSSIGAAGRGGFGYGGSDYGYAAVVWDGTSGEPDLALLKAVTLDDFTTATSATMRDGDGEWLMEMLVVTSLSYILGEYDAVMEAEAAAREAKRKATKERMAREEAHHKRVQAQVDALRAYGFKARPTGTRTIDGPLLGIPMDDIDRLLSLLADHVPAPTADGGACSTPERAQKSGNTHANAMNTNAKG